MWVEVWFWNESTGLADNGTQGTGVEFGMERNRQDLAALSDGPDQLDMAASLGDLLEAKLFEDCHDVAAGESPQFRHARGPTPWSAPT